MNTSLTHTTSINIPKPNMMTIQSGSNSIKAEAYPLWSHDLKSNVAADYERHTPKEMEGIIQILTLDLNSNSLTPFTPSIKGKEVYGQYALYDENYQEIPHLEPSGLAPQTYLFRNAKPGKYVVTLTITIETADSRSGYQYFFGVIVPEK